MCGIAGYFGSRHIDDASVRRCLDLMKRRGPDHAGYSRFKTPQNKEALLLHSRLSIIDLDPRANQPFERESKALVFNGEIYNYVEVKKELELKGIFFQTSSDTEVLLRAIEVGGWDVLDRLEGMWAFACFDATSNTLTLSRDRFGEKPLYLYQDESGVYFGSEIKFIFALLGHSLKINFNQIYRYLVNGYKSLYKTNEQFFEGLIELKPGSCQEYDATTGKSKEWKYWNFKFAPKASLTFSEAVEGVKERFLEAVRIRLRADVPLAFCLSGGIDSNAIVGVAKKKFGHNVHAFTIVNNDPRYDEQEMVNEMVGALGLKHTVVPVTHENFLPKLKEQIRYHDSPVSTISYYVHWLLQQEIHANGYRISVSGTGSDEIFTGYFDHHLAYLHEVHDKSKVYAESLEAWQKNIRPFVRNPYLSDPDLFHKDQSFRGHIYLQAEVFAQCLRKKWSESFFEEKYCEDLLRNRMLNEMFHEVVPVILHEDDLNAMYYSIENRSPFLDRRLFEYCLSIPTEHLIRNGRTKALLREAVKDYVPSRILSNTRKVGFNAPIKGLLNLEDPKIFSMLMEDGPIFEHIEREKIKPFLEKESLPNSESKFVFNFLNCKLFLEEFSK